MKTQNTQQLLHNYAANRSEAAFAELVRRHIDLVYSTALRMVRNTHAAEDVTQGVFIELARSANRLTFHPVLAGWLHLTARNLAANRVRADSRRQSREKDAFAMGHLHSTGADAGSKTIVRHLDAALGELSVTDRDAVLLRYFEKQSAYDIGAALGVSAEAAQKRVNRAVNRLRQSFARRGITIGSTGLAILVSSNSAQAAPTGLVASVSSAALASVAATTLATTKTIAMTMTHKLLITATAAALLGVAIYRTLGDSQPHVLKVDDPQKSLAMRSNSRDANQPGSTTLDRATQATNNAHSGRDELARKNGVLRKELAREKAVRAFFEQQYAFHNGMATKLARNNLPKLETEEDVAILMGQFHRASVDFEAKWHSKAPMDGTPEGDEHAREMDKLTTYAATLRKVMENDIGEETDSDANAGTDPTPAEIAQMQSLQLLGALELEEARWRELDTLLRRYYSEGFDRKLDLASRPETGVVAWSQQREEISRRAFGEVQALLSTQQRAAFVRLYHPDFLWNVQFGGGSLGPGQGNF